MRHANIALFVPHLGCPHQCTFCNQKHITGFSQKLTAEDVFKAVDVAVSNGVNAENTEIAFFGGSFTAIGREYMLTLLEAAYKCVKEQGFIGIRISTRPDYIDEEILKIIKNYGVTSIELGAQSMCDGVLLANERGHSSLDVIKASKLIKDSGFELGLQMMTGLYQSNDSLDIYTASELIKLKPNTVRIYPAITLKNTRLELLYNDGKYVPQSLSKAVELCTNLSEMFESAGISVIRLGLHDIDKEAYVAGPWHPAFRELCDSNKFRRLVDAGIKNHGEYIVKVNPADVSKMIGQKKENITYFKNKNINIKILQDKSVNKDSIRVEEVK